MKPSSPQRKHYLPPGRDQLVTYARAVCEGWARRRGEGDPPDLDRVNGLAHFLEVVSRIQAKHLNRTDELLDDEGE
jgi:hypothetical protein